MNQRFHHSTLQGASHFKGSLEHMRADVWPLLMRGAQAVYPSAPGIRGSGNEIGDGFTMNLGVVRLHESRGSVLTSSLQEGPSG